MKTMFNAVLAFVKKNVKYVLTGVLVVVTFGAFGLYKYFKNK